MRLYLKKPITKRAGGVAQGVNPGFKPQYCKKAKKILQALIPSSIKYGSDPLLRPLEGLHEIMMSICWEGCSFFMCLLAVWASLETCL
jgi:hypothetical protein